MNLPDWAIAKAIAPFVWVLILVPVTMLGRAILRRMPEGRAKRLLSRRVGP